MARLPPPPVQRLLLRQCLVVHGLLAARQIAKMLMPPPGAAGLGIGIIWVHRGRCTVRLKFMVYKIRGVTRHLQVPIQYGQAHGRIRTLLVQDLRVMIVRRAAVIEVEIVGAE
jgi:hypothetical protein